MRMYIPYQKKCKKELNKYFLHLLSYNKDKKPILIVCIGTDRSTGDAFGPFVGTFLKKKKKLGAAVLGTIEKPVHAKNLHEVNTEDYFTIAIDAGLGSEEHLKNYCFLDNSISPGKGVCKNLPNIGDCSIYFNVNTSSIMNIVMLQNTRLNDVYYPAQVLANVIYEALREEKIA